MFKYHIVQAFFTATVTCALVTTFFMQIFNNHQDIILGYTDNFVQNQQFSKVKYGDYQVFYIEKGNGPTIFDKSNLALNHTQHQDKTKIYTSFENYLDKDFNIGETISIDGVQGVLSGLYFPHHPVGKNFYAIFSTPPKTASITSIDSYSPPRLPPNLAGFNLITFMLMCGLVIFIFGLIAIFFGREENFIEEYFYIFKYILLFSSAFLIFFGIAYELSFLSICYGILLAGLSNFFALVLLSLLWNIKRA
ncbi:hypothetical protein PRVXH_002072 [Proteinivorax hydrogeniformans]|uniref:Uncharacterized protein n=1 Tax=Proteinivorax hydrogeniformans TaxID=1826727 RepID=A0AAU8HRQ1_9FIRM